MLIKVYIQPGAKRNEIAGRRGDAIKIRLNAQPIEGRANNALIEFLAEIIGIPKSDIRIKSGRTSRHKLVSIDCSETRLESIWPA